MSVDIAMPSLSSSMEEGTILRWLKADGDVVAAGDEIVEIETDKATMNHESEAGGVLEIVVREGDTVPVGTLIGRLQAADALHDNGTTTEVAGIVVLPALSTARRLAGELGIDLAGPTGHGPAGRITSSDVRGAVGVTRGAGPIPPAPKGVAASPVARRLAAEHGVDLASLTGTGPRGRIVKADVEATLANVTVPSPRPIAAAAVSATTSQHSVKGEITTVELTRVQQLIAQRMTETKATVPEFQVHTDVVMDEVVDLRASLKAFDRSAVVPSYNDLIVKVCAIALRRHPRVNGSYVDGGFTLHGRVNVGIAVTAEGALVVPVVHDADVKSLGEIARETRQLAERVRTGAITPPELSGGTFTVSNLGMFGVTAVTPVINEPQAAILGVGAMREVLARVDGEIVDQALLTLSLSCDHRILYGADAAHFLSEVKGLLESPLRMLL